MINVEYRAYIYINLSLSLSVSLSLSLFLSFSNRCSRKLIGISESDSHIRAIPIFHFLFCPSRNANVRLLCGIYTRRECSATLQSLWISSYVVPDHKLPLCRLMLGETDVTCYAPFPVNSVNIVDTLCCDQSGSSSLKGWLEAAFVKSNVEGECCEYYILFEMIRRYSYKITSFTVEYQWSCRDRSYISN